MASLRGSRRGAMTDPLRMISNQAPSSCRIGPGRSRTAALNQRTMAGSRSSSSIPASASTSATTAAECLICDSRATSLRRIAAPGVSWMPSMIRIARWTLSALPWPSRSGRRARGRTGGTRPPAQHPAGREPAPHPGTDVARPVEQDELAVRHRPQQAHVRRDSFLHIRLLAGAFLVEHAADREEQLLPVPIGLGQADMIDADAGEAGGHGALLAAQPARAAAVDRDPRPHPAHVPAGYRSRHVLQPGHSHR